MDSIWEFRKAYDSARETLQKQDAFCKRAEAGVGECNNCTTCDNVADCMHQWIGRARHTRKIYGLKLWSMY